MYWKKTFFVALLMAVFLPSFSFASVQVSDQPPYTEGQDVTVTCDSGFDRFKVANENGNFYSANDCGYTFGNPGNISMVSIIQYNYQNNPEIADYTTLQQYLDAGHSTNEVYTVSNFTNTSQSFILQGDVADYIRNIITNNIFIIAGISILIAGFNLFLTFSKRAIR